jgi:hypothetical protein
VTTTEITTEPPDYFEGWGIDPDADDTAYRYGDEGGDYGYQIPFEPDFEPDETYREATL